MLEDEGIKETIESIKSEEIKHTLIDLYGKNNLPKNIDEFIDVFFSEKVHLDKYDLEKYKKRMDDYRVNQSVNILYNITFIKDETKTLNDNDTKMRKILTEAFDKLQRKDKAELFANLNIFFEKYGKTDIGRRNLEIISENFNKNKESSTLENASNKWLEEILMTVNNFTPDNVLIDVKDLKVQYETKKGSTFDGFFFINNHNLSEIQKSKLKTINDIKSLNEFEAEVQNTSQIQISATADLEQGIEKDSIIRHSLSNSIISRVINDYHKNNPDAFSNAFKKTSDLYGGNSGLRGLVVTAFKEKYKVKNFDPKNPKYTLNILNESTEDNITPYKKILKYITKSPLLVMSSIINKDNNNVFSKDNIDSFLDLENKKPLIKASSYVSLFQESIPKPRRQKAYEQMSKENTENPISSLKIHEVERLLQYSALLKYDDLGDSNKNKISNKALEKYVENVFNLRAYSSSDKLIFDNEKMSKVDLNNLDSFIVKSLVMSENAKQNQKFLIGSTKENIDVLLDNILQNKDDSFYENMGYSKLDFLSKIQENFTENSLFKKGSSIPSLAEEKLKSIKYEEKMKNLLIKQINSIKKHGIDSDSDDLDLKFKIIIDAETNLSSDKDIEEMINKYSLLNDEGIEKRLKDIKAEKRIKEEKSNDDINWIAMNNTVDYHKEDRATNNSIKKKKLNDEEERQDRLLSDQPVRRTKKSHKRN